MNGGTERAVILLSGGLDSATVLAMARARRFECHTLSVHYGQRHSAELRAAEYQSAALGARQHRVMAVDLAGIGGSALTDPSVEVPDAVAQGPAGAETPAGAPVADVAIPITYVPARNTLLLSLALGWAEVLGAAKIFIGANAVDYSGYPDCRPEFIAAFEALARVATKAGVMGCAYRIEAPLIGMSKADIIEAGVSLGVDYAATVSCYRADAHGAACGRCDSCRLRAAGFAAANMADPTRYVDTGSSAPTEPPWPSEPPGS